MPRGGHNRKPDSVKALAGTLRPDRVHPEQDLPSPILRWPKAPPDFTPTEVEAWRKLGASLLPLRIIAKCHLDFVAIVARQRAFTEAALADPALPAFRKNQLIKSLRDSYVALCLTPSTLRCAQQLPEAQPEQSADPLDSLDA